MNSGSIPDQASTIRPRSPIVAAMRATALLLALAFAMPAGAQDAPHHVAAKDLTGKVATLKDGLVTATLPTGPGALVLIARRDRTGEAEVHANFADHFVVQKGSATVLVGGTIRGDRETAPGERRGGVITGATAYAVGPGDVVWIPAGLPHQVVVPAGGDFTYLISKWPAP